jgi:putative FmdB family regulatory protein
MYMPIYEYECQQCGEKFKDFSRLGEGEKQLECPKCGNNQVKRATSPLKNKEDVDIYYTPRYGG